MKGKEIFSVNEANNIRKLLREIRKAGRSQQKMLRNALRNQYKFYITDFDYTS